MKVRLTRKFSNVLNGIDLSRAHRGDMLDLSTREAELLVAEGWAEPADGQMPAEAADRLRRARKSRKSSKRR